MTFDLANLDTLSTAQEEGVDVELRHPVTNEPLGVTVRVASYESERVRRVKRRITDRALKATQGRRQTTAEDLERSTREMVAAAVISWSGLVYRGETLDCTPANVLRVLEEQPWIGEQIDAVAQDRAAFFRT